MKMMQWCVCFVLSMLMAATVWAGTPVHDCTGHADDTLCVDTDNNVCTIARCDDEECDQLGQLLPEDTACPDTDGNVCTIPSCNAAGDCSQTRSQPSGIECTGDGGQPGLCDSGVCVVSMPSPVP